VAPPEAWGQKAKLRELPPRKGKRAKTK
jgi:hypothetical protein